MIVKQQYVFTDTDKERYIDDGLTNSIKKLIISCI